MVYKESKFQVDMSEFGVFKFIEGKPPTKDGQLWKGETTDGEKMELAGCTNPNPLPFVAYWGWST